TLAGFTEDEILRLAASLERASEHPLAYAVLAAATERKLALAAASDFDAPPGKGVTGTVEGHRMAIGNASFMRDLGLATTALEKDAEALRDDGATAVFVAIDGRAAGIVTIADPVKATTPAALKALRERGVRVVMLTGDNRTTAQAVARRIGIGEVEAEVPPDQKSAVVARLKRQGRVVAMAG